MTVRGALVDVQLERLRIRVQHNCDVADARHAGDHSLCVYLLKMREYYRWERGLPLGAHLPRQRVGEWLAERERLWQGLEAAELEPVEWGTDRFDPFDADGVNAVLQGQGLVYSAGLGQSCRPHFFLADLERCQTHCGHTIAIAGREYARDLVAPPAMTLGRQVFIRRESLRRLLWERLEQWRWHPCEGPMSRAVENYDFEADAEAALEQMTEHEMQATLEHEMGEIEAGRLLSTEWEEMLATLPRSRVEFQLRAVRDHLADCLVTLPRLIEREDTVSIHVYVAGLSGMRRQLFPSLLSAYAEWVQSDDPAPLARAVRRGRTHWEQCARSILQTYRRGGAESKSKLERLADAAVL